MEVSIKFKLKELLNHGFVFGVTSSLQNVLSFILLPILTNYFTTAEFGVYSIILLASALASAIFYLGANSALGRFYYDEDTDLYRQQIISAALLVTGIGACTLLALALLFSSDLSVWLFHVADYGKAIKLSLIASAFGFLLNTMTLILRYEKRSVMFMCVILSGVILNFFITYILLTRYNYGLLAPIYGTLITSGLSFLILFLQQLSTITLKLNKGHVRQIINFGIQTSLSSLLFYLLDWVDRLIVKDMLPMSDVGIYSLGYRIGAVINVLLIMPFNLIWGPLRMQYAQNTNNKIFVSRVISYFTIAGLTLVFIATLFGADLMYLFFSNKSYYSASKVYPIIMFSIFIYGFQGIVDFGIYFYKKLHYYIIISAIGLVLNVAMNYWLIPLYGYIAAAYVSMLTYLFTTGCIFIVSRHYYKLTIEWSRVSLPFAYLILAYFVINYLPIPVNPLLVRGAVAIIAVFLIARFWLSKDEVSGLKKIIKK